MMVVRYTLFIQPFWWEVNVVVVDGTGRFKHTRCFLTPYFSCLPATHSYALLLHFGRTLPATLHAPPACGSCLPPLRPTFCLVVRHPASAHTPRCLSLPSKHASGPLDRVPPQPPTMTIKQVGLPRDGNCFATENTALAGSCHTHLCLSATCGSLSCNWEEFCQL